MSSQISHDAFRTIFPKYSELLSESSLPGNESIETFLREELPRKVELVRNMESSFNAFLTHFTTTILKRPQHSHLLHSLVLKASDKIEKYFHQLSLITHKIDQNQLRERLTRLDLQYLKKEFRLKIENTQSLLKEKYFGGAFIERECEEQIAMRLYVLFEIYHFLKGDPVTIASKFRLREQDVLWTVSKNQQPNDIADLISLDSGFISLVEETVQKRCRPFSNKRDLLEGKVREVLREGESRVSPNLNLLLESLISKERVRISRELGNSLGRQLRDIPECEGESEAKEMIGQVQVLKREFAQLKNTTYFLDIMRGSFSEKYKMEVNRLENVFYLTNLEKFLQDVSTFLEKVLSLEERVIRNRREYMRNFGEAIEIKLSDLIDSYGGKPSTPTLSQIIQGQFELLQSALYGIVSKPAATRTEAPSYQREDRESREAERRRQMEIKAQEERERREAEKIKAEERRRKDQERLQQARQERQEKQKKRREQNERLELERKADLQRKRQEKARKDEELKRQRDQQLSKKQEQEKIKREEQAKKRQEQEEKKKKQREQDLRRREEEKRRILDKQQQQKRKRQADLKQRRKLEEEQRLKREKQRKAEEERMKREKEERQIEQKRKQEDRLKIEKEKRQRQLKEAEERRKEEEKSKRQKQQRDKQQRQTEEKRKQEEKLKAEKQKREREAKQAEEKNKREMERKERQMEDKRKEEQRLRAEKERKEKQREKKAEEERLAREKEQKLRKQQEEKQKLERQKKQREDRQKRERDEKERRERQQRQRKDKEQRQKREKEDRERKEREERQRKEKLERQRKQKEERQKKQREQKQRRQREERQRRQKQERQRKEKLQRQKREKQQKQRKQRQEKERLQKEKLEKQRKLREQRELEQKKQRQQQQRLRKEQQAKKNAAKKPEPKKSSGINYGDFDDLVDDDIQQIQKAGVSKASEPQHDNEADEYIDDFDDQSPQKEGEIDQKQLIGLSDIKCLNDYMKGTTYARKNKVNAQLLNKKGLYMLLLEEFVQTRKLFVFDGALSKALMDLGEQMANPESNEDDLRMSVDTIKEEMIKSYDDTFPDENMEMNTRYIFPFPFANQLHIKLIQFIPAHCHFEIVFDERLPEEEQLQSQYQGIIEGMLYIFQLDGEPAAEEIVINEESKLVLGTFDKDLPCLLLLFARHYEPNIPKEILINQYTIERFFYTSHPIQPFYEAIKEEEQITEFYSKLAEKYAKNDKIKIMNIDVSSNDQQYQEKLAHSALAIKEEFLKSKHQSFLSCFTISIEDESGEAQEKISVYLSLDRASPKPTANYFVISKDQAEQENASLIFQCISAEGDENFEVTAYTDFTRHFCLSTYSDWALPLWAHTTVKRKLSTLQAMRALSFAMTPFYIAFKEMD